MLGVSEFVPSLPPQPRGANSGQASPINIAFRLRDVRRNAELEKAAKSINHKAG